MATTDVKVDEDLPNFTDVVKHIDAKAIIAENETLQERYGIEIYESYMIDDLYKCLDSYPRCWITGCPWYNILNNPLYAEAFAYIPPHVVDRDFYIEDCDDDDENNGEQSDVVLILLNLGSIPDYVAQKFTLRQGFSASIFGVMHDYKELFHGTHNIEW